MATTICPYCDTEVSEKEIEAEDGCCPECGAMLSAGSMYMDGDMDDYDPYEESDYLDDDDDDLDREDAYLDDDVLSDIFDDDEFGFDEDLDFDDEDFDDDFKD